MKISIHTILFQYKINDLFTFNRKYMANNLYPRNVEELVRSSWYSRLKTLVSNFRLNEPIEDTLGDILLEMLEKKYLERWEPSAGSYSNWIYTFSANVCKKKYNRSNTKGGLAIEGASSIHSSAENDDMPIGVFFEETLKVESKDYDEAEYSLLCEELDRILSAYPAHSSNVHEGIVYDRDMKTVFKLLRQEYQPKEIAELFGTSVEFIYTLIRRMRPIIIQVI